MPNFVHLLGLVTYIWDFMVTFVPISDTGHRH